MEWFILGVAVLAGVGTAYVMGVQIVYDAERRRYGTDPLPALKMALVWPWHALTGRKG